MTLASDSGDIICQSWDLASREQGAPHRERVTLLCEGVTDQRGSMTRMVTGPGRGRKGVAAVPGGGTPGTLRAARCRPQPPNSEKPSAPRPPELWRERARLHDAGQGWPGRAESCLPALETRVPRPSAGRALAPAHRRAGPRSARPAPDCSGHTCPFAGCLPLSRRPEGWPGHGSALLGARGPRPSQLLLGSPCGCHLTESDQEGQPHWKGAWRRGTQQGTLRETRGLGGR